MTRRLTYKVIGMVDLLPLMLNKFNTMVPVMTVSYELVTILSIDKTYELKWSKNTFFLLTVPQD